MAKIKQKFKLEKDFLEKLIQPYKQKHKEIIFIVEKSKYSNSLYIYLNYEETILTLRISDHKTNTKWHKNQIITTDQTTCNEIINQIKNLIERIKRKRIYYLLNKIKGDKWKITKVTQLMN